MAVVVKGQLKCTTGLAHRRRGAPALAPNAQRIAARGWPTPPPRLIRRRHITSSYFLPLLMRSFLTFQLLPCNLSILPFCLICSSVVKSYLAEHSSFVILLFSRSVSSHLANKSTLSSCHHGRSLAWLGRDPTTCHLQRSPWPSSTSTRQ